MMCMLHIEEMEDSLMGQKCYKVMTFGLLLGCKRYELEACSITLMDEGLFPLHPELFALFFFPKLGTALQAAV